MNKIALIGYLSEKTFAYAVSMLKMKGCVVDVLDLCQIRESKRLEMIRSKEGLSILTEAFEFSLEQYQAIYQRCYYSEGASSKANLVISEIALEINAFLATCDAYVLNRPAALESNGSKLFHLEHLKRCGFLVPRTYIVSDFAVSQKVFRPDGSWVSKGCSGVRTEVSVFDVAMYSRLSESNGVPAQFQSRIRGSNVRAHMIGSRVTAVGISSASLDYRYATETASTSFFSIEIPEAIAVAMQQYRRLSGLEFIGFDFRIDEHSGSWIVLEANPMPGFDYYDKNSDGAVSTLLANALNEASVSEFRQKWASNPYQESTSLVEEARRHVLPRP
jgi:glutathione synthase/RimK-type ligase-like ATP-grasp enzyme